jgi:hypothetical protein
VNTAINTPGSIMSGNILKILRLSASEKGSCANGWASGYYSKSGNVRINVILRSVHVTTVALKKQ